MNNPIIPLKDVVHWFGRTIKNIDNSGSAFKEYHPGVGPFGEPQLIKMIVENLRSMNDHVMNTAITKRHPDFLIPNHWAIETKIIRPFGDNGKEAEHWSQNLIHPYKGNVSSIGDIYKLRESTFEEKKAILIVMYENNPPSIDLSRLVDSFEIITKKVLTLSISERFSETISGLIHPEHRQAVIHAWEVYQ